MEMRTNRSLELAVLIDGPSRQASGVSVGVSDFFLQPRFPVVEPPCQPTLPPWKACQDPASYRGDRLLTLPGPQAIVGGPEPRPARGECP
jgi:hypothetical protein